jgi:hypothetical protein
MKQAEFEQILVDAGLNPISKYAPRFLVVLRVPTTYGVRHQCDVLELTHDELEKLTPEDAQQRIEACKRSLLRAANTKQGRTTAERAPRAKKKVVEKEVVVSTLKYPVR